MNVIKLSKRQTVEVLLNQSCEVVANADTTLRKFIITPQDKVVLSQLINVLCASISTFDHNVSPTKFFDNYLSINHSTGNRIFFSKTTHKIDKDVMIQTLKECEEIANRELGTLEELKKNNDVNKELVVQ